MEATIKPTQDVSYIRRWTFILIYMDVLIWSLFTWITYKFLTFHFSQSHHSEELPFLASASMILFSCAAPLCLLRIHKHRIALTASLISLLLTYPDRKSTRLNSSHIPLS